MIIIDWGGGCQNSVTAGINNLHIHFLWSGMPRDTFTRFPNNIFQCQAITWIEPYSPNPGFLWQVATYEGLGLTLGLGYILEQTKDGHGISWVVDPALLNLNDFSWLSVIDPRYQLMVSLRWVGEQFWADGYTAAKLTAFKVPPDNTTYQKAKDHLPTFWCSEVNSLLVSGRLRCNLWCNTTVD